MTSRSIIPLAGLRGCASPDLAHFEVGRATEPPWPETASPAEDRFTSGSLRNRRRSGNLLGSLGEPPLGGVRPSIDGGPTMGRDSYVNGARRVVVTGTGVVTPIGNDVPTFWAGLKEGRSGIGPLQDIDFPEQYVRDLYIKIACQVKNFDPKTRLKNRLLSARRPLLALGGDGGRRSLRASQAGSPARQPLSRGLHHRLGRRRHEHHRVGLQSAVHQESPGRRSAAAPEIHRQLGGGPRRHRLRHQGADLRHGQRLRHRLACHRPHAPVHPRRLRRCRRCRRLGGRHQLRLHEGLAVHARALARRLLPLRQEAQWHGARRGRRHPGHGGAGARTRARRQDPRRGQGLRHGVRCQGHDQSRSRGAQGSDAPGAGGCGRCAPPTSTT